MSSQEPKLKLSVALGALVSSFAFARSVADTEALRIAQRYRQNELLRGLPVPRLRFTRISMDLPVVIVGIVAGAPAEPAAPSVVASAAARALAEGLDALAREGARLAYPEALAGEEAGASGRALKLGIEALSRERDALSATFEADLQRELDDDWLDLQRASGDVPPSDTALWEKARETSEKLLRRLLRRTLLREQAQRATPEQPVDPRAARQQTEAALLGKPFEALVQRVSSAAGHAAVLCATEPADVEVLVETSAVKNAGSGPGLVTQLHLTLVEEGLEWVGEEQRDGTRMWKLSQE
jgi:hypothetical protein